MARLPRTPEEDRRRKLILLIGGGAAAILLLFTYLIMIFTLGNKIPGGTTIAGVDVGGMSKGQADVRIRDTLRERMAAFKVSAGGKEYPVNAARAGLEFDVSATVDKAYVETTLNPITLFQLLAGSGGEVPPVVKSDPKKLDATLASLAKRIDGKPREGGVTFKNGKALAIQPAAGHKLDRNAAGDAIRQGYVSTAGPIGLRTSKTDTKVSKAEVDAAMQKFAEPAMSGPLRLAFGDEKSVEATPEELSGALSMTVSESGGLTPKLDPEVLVKTLDGKLKKILSTPKDASIKMVGGRPTVVPSKTGYSADPKTLPSVVLPALMKEGADRTAAVKTVKQEPKLTTAKLNSLGVKEVTGEFTTHFPYAEYRNINIGRAGEKINGQLILPGKTFSLNGIVGERTAANGFAKGYVIKGGKMDIEQGGGVSQVATTTYNAAFFAGMRDVEHRPHAFYISRYPVGREATVYWGSLDLKWKNTTPYAVYVDASVAPASGGSRGSITVKLWSTKYYDVKENTSARYEVKPYETIEDDRKKGCVDQPEGQDGFKVDVTRELYRNGERVSRTVDKVTYKPEDKIVCKYPTRPPD